MKYFIFVNLSSDGKNINSLFLLQLDSGESLRCGALLPLHRSWVDGWLFLGVRGRTVWLECYAGKIFLLKIHTPTHISLESLYKAGHDDIVNGAIKHL